MILKNLVEFESQPLGKSNSVVWYRVLTPTFAHVVFENRGSATEEFSVKFKHDKVRGFKVLEARECDGHSEWHVKLPAGDKTLHSLKVQPVEQKDGKVKDPRFKFTAKFLSASQSK